MKKNYIQPHIHTLDFHTPKLLTGSTQGITTDDNGASGTVSDDEYYGTFRSNSGEFWDEE